MRIICIVHFNIRLLHTYYTHIKFYAPSLKKKKMQKKMFARDKTIKCNKNYELLNCINETTTKNEISK